MHSSASGHEHFLLSALQSYGWKSAKNLLFHKNPMKGKSYLSVGSEKNHKMELLRGRTIANTTAALPAGSSE